MQVVRVEPRLVGHVVAGDEVTHVRHVIGVVTLGSHRAPFSEADGLVMGRRERVHNIEPHRLARERLPTVRRANRRQWIPAQVVAADADDVDIGVTGVVVGEGNVPVALVDAPVEKEVGTGHGPHRGHLLSKALSPLPPLRCRVSPDCLSPRCRSSRGRGV